MNPDGTYHPSISGAAPIHLSDMLKQAIGPDEGGYIIELGQAPMAVMSGGAIVTGNTKARGGKIIRNILRKIAANKDIPLYYYSTLADPSVVVELTMSHQSLGKAAD